MKVALIDGDSLCFISSKDTIQSSIKNIDSMMRMILAKTSCDRYLLFLSRGKYFRHRVNEDYKGNRKNMKSTLVYLRTLKQYLVEEYGGLFYDNLEADDLVAFAARTIVTKKYGGITSCVICSPDKDVIGQIPGWHFSYKSHDFIKTTPDDALRFLWYQTLIGDSTDNISGIPGVGKKTANKILDSLEDCSYEERVLKMQNIVFETYLKKYKRIHVAMFEMQQNFRQVYLLREEEEYLREVGYVPKLPDPKKLS